MKYEKARLSIASLIEFPENSIHTTQGPISSKNFGGSKGVFGIIGAGNYSSAMIIPKLKSAQVNIKYIASAGSLSSATLAKKADIAMATSDYKEILKDSELDTVVITTRHDLQAKMRIEALRANKNVFVEKPMCLDAKELAEIEGAYKETDATLTVGYNRRFAPLAVKMKALLGNGVMNIVATMNAGEIPTQV